MAEQPRFQDVGGDQFQGQIKSDDRHRLDPALELDEAHRQREQRRQGRSDVGHVAEHGNEERPQHRVIDADHGQAQAEHEAETRIDDQLGQQEPAEPLPGVVHRLGRHGHVALAKQADEAVAQVLAGQHHEQRQHGHQGDLAEEFERGRGVGRHPL